MNTENLNPILAEAMRKPRWVRVHHVFRHAMDALCVLIVIASLTFASEHLSSDFGNGVVFNAVGGLLPLIAICGYAAKNFRSTLCHMFDDDERDGRAWMSGTQLWISCLPAVLPLLLVFLAAEAPDIFPSRPVTAIPTRPAYYSDAWKLVQDTQLTEWEQTLKAIYEAHIGNGFFSFSIGDVLSCFAFYLLVFITVLGHHTAVMFGINRDCRIDSALGLVLTSIFSVIAIIALTLFSFVMWVAVLVVVLFLRQALGMGR